MDILRRIQYNSPVVLTFALLSLAATVAGLLTGGAATALLFSVYRSPMTDPLSWVRLFTHVLGHADLSHYVGNMTFFLLLGPMIEEKYGSLPLLGMMAATALITALANLLLFPGAALLGASGLVFLFIVLSSMVHLEEGRIPLTLILVVAIYLGQEIYDGVMARDNISQFTHILGGVCGGVFGWLMGRWERQEKTGGAQQGGF
jgi:membrane associated rhomboid family serine protease